MKKIDTSKISGFDKMTPDEKLKALLDFEYDDGSLENEKLKAALTKANGEAAEYKRQLKENMSAEDRKKAETEELITALKEQNAQLQRQQKINEYEAQLKTQGYDSKLALEMATAMFEGDQTRIMECMTKFNEELAKKQKQDSAKGAPKPAGAGGGTVKTRKEIMEITDDLERQKAIAENLGAFGYTE